MEAKKMISIIFEDGDEVLAGLKQAFSENKVQRATIKSVEGKIKDLEINIYGAGVFKRRHFDESFKVTSMHGTFLEKGNTGYKGELFVSLASENTNSLGGTLASAKVTERLAIKADILEFK
ncbi:DNA-binding protein [Candidatus Micrarchaeota archaeon]|nr:DNA-binding protein [Candidatus Micrarchaeota archaeon]MBU2477326.1 DNA-binding protein [Candidatus Micrarchaeota archaeon]